MNDPGLSTDHALDQWVTANTTREDFWGAAPFWSREVTRERVGPHFVVWTDVGLFTIGVLGTAVAVHFEGSATLGELAEDLAAAVDIPVERARIAVAGVAVDLVRLGALEGLTLAEPPEPSEPHSSMDAASTGDDITGPDGEPLGESTRIDQQSGEEIRVVTEVNADGGVVTTEYLADGRRRISTMWTSGSTSGFNPVDAARVLAGDRSPAELVPPDSCLGSKLRDGEDVPLLSFRCRDGRIRSIRCHAPEVAEELSRIAGDAHVTSGERGPVIAFVVTPLKGSGPIRIYDGLGRRRGRPRSSADVVEILDQMLAEATYDGTPVQADSPIPIDLSLIESTDRAVLVPVDLLDKGSSVRRLEVDGWRIAWGRPHLMPDHSVSVSSTFGARPEATRWPLDSVAVATFGEAESNPAALIPLLRVGPTVPLNDRRSVLARVCHFVQGVNTASIESIFPATRGQLQSANGKGNLPT